MTPEASTHMSVKSWQILWTRSLVLKSNTSIREWQFCQDKWPSLSSSSVYSVWSVSVSAFISLAHILKHCKHCTVVKCPCNDNCKIDNLQNRQHLSLSYLCRPLRRYTSRMWLWMHRMLSQMCVISQPGRDQASWTLNASWAVHCCTN